MPQSHLHDLHAELGARFTDFGGWKMPVQYEGVIAEHQAVRESVGVFDVSHLGRFCVEGPDAAELIRGQLCNDISKIGPGRAQYSMALNDEGGIVDDVIVWRLSDERYWVMPNGTNFDDILERFIAAAADGVTVRAVREETVLLAVQGPEAAGIVTEVLGSMPGRFRVEEGEYLGSSYAAAGTGYTGERGAEIAVAPEQGANLLQDLIRAGAVPCGLGARDTLRLEMGYPLWGQDLDEETTPLEAGLGWVVAWDHEFVGKNPLVEQRDGGLPRTMVAFATEGRAIPRHGYAVRAGESTGTVSSGNFSPTLGHGIGLAYLSPPPGDGVQLEVEIRRSWVPATIEELPFLRR
ncbi:MAG: glycine cleavage system aminomethyltransferase GcvT [Actinomycetota bacterium]